MKKILIFIITFLLSFANLAYAQETTTKPTVKAPEELKILLSNNNGGYDVYVTEIPTDPEKLKQLLINMAESFQAVANAYIADNISNRSKFDSIMNNVNAIKLDTESVSRQNSYLQKEVTSLVKNQAKTIFVAIQADVGAVFGTNTGMTFGAHPEIGYNLGNQFLLEGGIGFETISPASIGITANIGIGYWIR